MAQRGGRAYSREQSGMRYREGSVLAGISEAGQAVGSQTKTWEGGTKQACKHCGGRAFPVPPGCGESNCLAFWLRSSWSG